MSTPQTQADELVRLSRREQELQKRLEETTRLIDCLSRALSTSSASRARLLRALSAMRAERDALTAEVERLRAAGDVRHG